MKDTAIQIAATTESNVYLKRGLSEPFGAFKPKGLQTAIIETVRRNPLLRSFVRSRTNRLLQRIRAGAIDYTLYGWSFRFFADENTGDRKALLTPSGFDKEECDLIVQHVQKDGVFLDIGSNIGIYSFYIAAKRKDMRIFAFEPTPRVYAKLSFNLATNKLNDRVTALNLALADRKGEMRFNTQLESLVLGEGDTKVKTDTLLNILTDYDVKAVDAMKIDVEGAEDKVLRPFFETADKSLWPRLIVIEHVLPEEWDWNCIDFLKENGYLQTWQGKMNTIYTLKEI